MGVVNPVKPMLRMCASRSGTRRGSEMLVRDWKMRSPSGTSQSCSDSSLLSPEERKSCNAPPWSMRVITPWRAPVSEHAESSTPCSTWSKSRLSLMRRLAWLRRDRRSRSASISRSRWFALAMSCLLYWGDGSVPVHRLARAFSQLYNKSHRKLQLKPRRGYNSSGTVINGLVCHLSEEATHGQTPHPGKGVGSNRSAGDGESTPTSEAER